jgi:glutaredoxin-like protein
VNDLHVSKPAPSTASGPAAGPAADPGITVYWRPGCGFCGSLLRQLEHHGIDHQRVNIWQDEHGAAVVRSIARGNETVPTVVVGDVGMVNPSIDDVVAAMVAAPAAR